jgi:hypothetical protein
MPYIGFSIMTVLFIIRAWAFIHILHETKRY